MKNEDAIRYGIVEYAEKCAGDAEDAFYRMGWHAAWFDRFAKDARNITEDSDASFTRDAIIVVQSRGGEEYT